MTYQEFLNKLQKRGSKPHVITHCLGARDAWKWLRRNKWQRTKGRQVSQPLYSSIIDTVNQILVEQLIEGHEIELPMRMGSFYIASMPAKVAIEEGQMKTNYRTDWLKTLKLWYEDEEARNTHKSIKRIQKDIYFILYSKHKATFTNRMFYVFRANRSLVKKVGKAIEDGSIRACKLDIK
jgi:hypothetical protein